MTRQGIDWLPTVRKENNSIRAILYEKDMNGQLVPTPEDPGSPICHLFGPRIELKMRCAGLTGLEHWLGQLYPGGYTVTKRLLSREWALIASLDGGEIPLKYFAPRDMSLNIDEHAWNEQIYEAGLKTQNYDKGLGRFVRKFDSDNEMSATFAIVKGVHQDHGSAIYYTQASRRCLLLDTLHGQTDEEAMWYTLQTLAKFQPRLNKPRTEPGQLFYPAEYSHVFEKYWQHLTERQSHPDSSSESPHTLSSMSKYSEALSHMDCSCLQPLVHAEAEDSHVKIATEVAISRLLPIMDGPDLWSQILESRSSSDTRSGGPAPV
jgi:hypothetical protein